MNWIIMRCDPLNRLSVLGGLIFLLYWFMGLSSAHAGTLLLQENRPYSISGALEILRDSSSRLSLRDILTSDLLSKGFEPIPGFLNKSYTSDTLWVRFDLQRTDAFPTESFLMLGPPPLDFVTIYVQTGDDANNPAAYTEFQLGDHLPTLQRPIIHLNFVVPLNLPIERTRRVYIRLKTTSVMNLTGEILPLKDFISQTTRLNLMHEGWFAIAIFVGLISLRLYWRLRDPLYAYYGLYILVLIASRASASGMLAMLWPQQAHYFADITQNVGICLTFLFIILFGIKLFGDIAKRWEYHFLKLALLLSIVAILCIPFISWGTIFRTILLVIIPLFCLFSWLSLRLAKRGEGGGWLYFFSFFVYSIASIITLMRLSGILSIAWWNANITQIGLVCHLILLALALIERLYSIEQKALSAERNAKQNAINMAAEMTVELRENQEELKKALERQVRFVSMVSHEYRTPLAIIQGNLDLISVFHDDPEGNLSFAVGKMQRAVTRLVEVLEISLGKVRMAEETMTVQKEALLLSPFVAEIMVQAADFWTDRQYVLSNKIDENLNINADSRLMKTALLNLLDNAVKYSQKGSTVEVLLHVIDEAVEISVIDQGRGIPVDERKRVLEKYYRCRGIGKISGAGLGLYLVARIVEEHLGQITITEGITGGTKVSIQLPISNSHYEAKR